MNPNVLLVALKGACSDSVLHDGEPFIEEDASAAVGGQRLASARAFSSSSSLAAASLRLLARRTTRRPSAMMSAAIQRPSLASVNRTLALATSPCRHAAAS
jgi:hypothetical protein